MVTPFQGPSDGADNSTLRILVVDDSTPVRELVVAKLSNLANPLFTLQIDQATSGEEALSMVKHQIFDLIFLDVEMPGMGGLAACKELKEEGCTARVAMLSGMTSADAHRAGRQAGCDNYLIKPPHDGDLRAILRLVYLSKRVTA